MDNRKYRRMAHLKLLTESR